MIQVDPKDNYVVGFILPSIYIFYICTPRKCAMLKMQRRLPSVTVSPRVVTV